MTWRVRHWPVSLGVFAGAILISTALLAQISTPTSKYAGTAGASCAGLGIQYAWPDINGQILQCVSNVWTVVGQTVVPAGSNGQVQFNNAGSMAGDSSFVYTTPGALQLGLSGTLGSLAFGNATSGTVKIQPVTGALGSVTLSLPAATDTLVGKATTDTLTNKTYDSAGTGNVLKISGITVSGLQGSGGSLVMAGTPTLTTPVLGVATATSINGLTITSSTGTLTITNGKTLVTSNSLTLAGTDGTTMTFPGASDTVGGLGTAQTWTAANTHNVARTIASGAAATLDDIGVTAATTTISGTTTIATAKGFNKVSIYKPTYTDASAVTVTNAATLYIDNAPAAAGSVTITNPLALDVAAGTSYFGGNVGIGTNNPFSILDVRTGTGHRVAFRDASLIGGLSTAGMIEAYNDPGSAAIPLEIESTTLVLNAITGGNVGIGTTNPAFAKLQINVGPNENFWLRAAASNPNLSFGNDSGGAYVAGSIDASPLILNTLSGGNVGIGTTAPSNQLSVINSVNGTQPTILQLASQSGPNWQSLTLGYNNTSNYGYIQATTYNVSWDKLAINPNGGNVGIGSTAPIAPLQVAGGVSWTTNGWSRSLAVQNAIQLRYGSGNRWGIASDGNYVVFESTADDTSAASNYAFYIDGTTLNTTIGNYGNAGSKLGVYGNASIGTGYYTTAAPSNGMIVQGNVGIGNTAPGNLLTVGSTNGQSNANISARAGNPNSFEWGHSNTAGYGSTIGFDNGNGNPWICFSCEASATNNDYRTRGNVGTIIKGDTVGGLIIGKIATANADLQSATALVTIANTGNMTVSGSGSTCVIGSGTGATNCTSDERLKKDIARIPDALNKLAQLKGVTFHWTDPAKSETEHIGVIAQDVEKVFPQAVGSVENKTLGTAKTVDIAALVAPIIEALKELKTMFDGDHDEIVKLKADNDNMQARLSALEAKSR
jgi:Chaperone of endosialidase